MATSELVETSYEGIDLRGALTVVTAMEGWMVGVVLDWRVGCRALE